MNAEMRTVYETLEKKPELLKLFNLLIDIPKDQRKEIVDNLIEMFGEGSVKA